MGWRFMAGGKRAPSFLVLDFGTLYDIPGDS
jgi:hypothetical protein